MIPQPRHLRARRMNEVDKAIRQAIRNGVPMRDAYLANVPPGSRLCPTRLLQGPACTPNLVDHP